MTFVEQLLPLRWGEDLSVARIQNQLIVIGTMVLLPHQQGQSKDIWERYRAFPRNWSADRALQSPHIEFANADTDDKLVSFVERFGPVVASSYTESMQDIAAHQDMSELRDEQVIYSSALRLLSELQRQDEPNQDHIMKYVRDIVAKLRSWPDQWKRESGLRTPEYTDPQWNFQPTSFDRIENFFLSAEVAYNRPAPATPMEADMQAWINPASDPVRVGQYVLCELINAFPAKIQPMDQRRAVEWPEPDLSYGIRPLLYLILRRTWLVGSVGICANGKCRRLFEIDRMPYCSDECSRHERQRRYWNEKGSARRQKLKRQRKAQKRKQKIRTSSNLVAQEKPASEKAKEAHTRTQALTRPAQHEKEIAAPAKKRARTSISEAIECTGTTNRDTESLLSTIKRSEEVGNLGRGKGLA
jgi:hypothetical protein